MSATDLPRFEELLSRHLDDALTDGDAAELHALLAEPELAARFLEMMRLNSEIAGVLAAPVPDGAMVELVRADIENCVTAPQAVVSMRPRRAPALRALAWAAVFLVLAGVAVVWFVNRERPAAAPTVASSIASSQGDVRVTGADGERALQPGEPWQRGETLKIVGPKSAATVAFDDGTRLDFAGNSVAVNQSGAEGRRVEMERGDVQCAVQPQPARQPFVFATPDAEAVVLGTTFQVTTVNHHDTRVVVTEGQVRVKRRADGAEVTVAAGFHVLITPKGKLKADTNDAKQFHR